MPKPKIIALLVIRKIARWPSSNGSRFSACKPKYDENRAGKIIVVRVSKTITRVQKKNCVWDFKRVFDITHSIQLKGKFIKINPVFLYADHTLFISVQVY